MSETPPPAAAAAQLAGAWGAEIDPELLVLALTHRSFANENGGIPNNERLEFLGDAVLQLIVTEKLFTTYPDVPEGDLARMRAVTVSQAPLAQVARQVGLGQYILLGRGEVKTNGADKDSILSDTMEAMIGATYLSHGMEVTRRVVLGLLGGLLLNVRHRASEMDWKATLFAVARSLELGEVTYNFTGSGPEHARRYLGVAQIGETTWGEATDSSKKHAGQLAAKAAVMALQQAYDIPDSELG